MTIRASQRGAHVVILPGPRELAIRQAYATAAVQFLVAAALKGVVIA